MAKPVRRRSPPRPRKSAPKPPAKRATRAARPRPPRVEPSTSPPVSAVARPRPDLSWMYYKPGEATPSPARQPPAPPTSTLPAAPTVAPSPAIKGPRLEQVALLSGRGIGGLALLALMFGPLILLVLLTLQSIEAGVEPTGGNAVTTAFDLILIITAFVFLPVIYVWLVRPRDPIDEHLRLRDPRGALRFLIGLAVAIGMVLVLALSLYAYTLISGNEPEAESPALRNTEQMLLDHPYFVFLIPLVAGFGEEIFFRGFLQRRVGIFASAAIFGIVHIGYATWLQIIAPFVAGLVFGYLVKRTGSLWIAIGAHFGFDFIQLGIAYLSAQNPELAGLVAFT